MISGGNLLNFINIRSKTFQRFLTWQYSPKNIYGRSIFNTVEGCKMCYIASVLYDNYITISFNDTHREKIPSNKTPALTGSMNKDIWIVWALIELFIRGF